MKHLLILFITGTALCLQTFFISKNQSQGQCGMAITYAEMAYKDFKKAYKSSSIDEAKKSIKAGVIKATQSSAYAIAPECNCANAKNYALNSVTFGNKAIKSNDLESLKEQVKKAMDASLDVLTAVPGCK